MERRLSWDDPTGDLEETLSERRAMDRLSHVYERP
jgi:hypothetical protein